MDRKKYIEYPNKIDRKEYEKNYKKEHYARFVADLKPEEKKRVDDYCQKEGISKTEFIRRAVEMLEKQR
ncbi:MAG: ribbon-helix-helix protein, CopG family [Prevotella sp.]|nr:ribbon-helix-helix protein, CopG family [Prevotella sp.]